MKHALDTLDIKIIELLEKDGRLSWVDLARKVQMSSPGLIDRVRRLEGHGLISSYQARIGLAAAGLGVTAFILVSLVPSARREEFVRLVAETDEIEECHHVTGAHDYLLKVHCVDTAHLDELLVDTLKASGLIRSSETTISLKSEKDGTNLAAMLRSKIVGSTTSRKSSRKR